MNLSNRHLSHSGLPSRLDQLAGRHHVAPSSVSLEITESAAMLDPGHVRKVLLAIRDQGFSLALDDFGTGYSSLSHVKRLPIDTLKIDRAFVDGVTADRDDRAIDRIRGDLKKGMDGLEPFLSGPFAVGPAMTLADCALLPTLFYVQKFIPSFGVSDPLAQYPAMAAIWAHAKAQPMLARM